MKPSGLLLKIWLTMVILVTLVFGLSAIIQAGLAKNVYFNKEAERLALAGEDFIEKIDLSGNTYDLDARVKSLGEALGAVVLLIDADRNIIGWSGGRGTGRMPAPGGMMRGRGLMSLPREAQAALSGQKVVKTGVRSSEGWEDIMVALPVHIRDGKTGALVMLAPMAPLKVNLQALQANMLYTFLAGLAMATVIALFFTRRITGPILLINEAARAMAGGNYGQKVPVESGDELGVLSRSINTLAGQLSEKINTIEMLDRTRRDFVASISHELRTPLTIIQGYAEALLDGMAVNDAQKEKYAMNIYDETVRMRRLVDDLLDLRRLETGNVSLSQVQSDVCGIVIDVAERYREAGLEKGITLKTDMRDDCLPVNADPDRLRQVIINLVDNAVTFSPPGGMVKITGEIWNNYVKIQVADQGPGLLNESLELIWERFYSGAREKGERKGAGLGLAIAKKIIEMHGGQIGVAGTPGGGAAFWFTLPATQADPEHSRSG